ncbi:ribonuclease H-like domain-containing protein [Tanacetum coccineum]
MSGTVDLNSNSDNNCTIEFDGFGFSVKDFLTRHILLRCDSSGGLYPDTSPSPTPHALLSLKTCEDIPFASSESIVTRSFEISPSVALSDPNWRYKARLVANGRNQQFGVDCDDTFSPVIKPATIYTILSLALSQNWPIHQLDDKNAFFNDDLFETVYMYQPPGFVDDRFPHHVGFLSSRCDLSLFIYQHGSEVAYLLIYVDDIVLTASSMDLLQRIISSLNKEFDMTDLAHMANCNPTRTPVDTESKVGSDGDPISDPTLYRSLACALKRVLRYVRGTLDFGLQHYASITRSLVAYTDADWAGCPTTRRSTSGYCVFLRDNLLSWSAKRQHTLSRSSVEAEYRGVANHQRTKHIEIDIHFVRDMVAHGQVRVLHVPSRYRYADIFTKGLPYALFEEFRTSLSVRPSPAQTAEEC